MHLMDAMGLKVPSSSCLRSVLDRGTMHMVIEYRSPDRRPGTGILGTTLTRPFEVSTPLAASTASIAFDCATDQACPTQPNVVWHTRRGRGVDEDVLPQLGQRRDNPSAS
jgi:hypothetical protein